uniref:U3 small nucleolar RNA-associated protein 20 N-terminal domain-containing protein n=1 Tax=Panagrolaimus sp. ES5 TaxID=591445 RepID=A0AC34F3S1_9BILA
MGKRTLVADTNEKQFKYVSFTDQISRISADTISTRLKLPGEVYEHETYFYQAVAKWNDLDYGDDYKAFLDDIPYGELATYAQLLHYQNQIVDALRHHLLIPGSKACITLLELSVALIRDLNDDFYPHLWDYFDTIMILLDRSRHEIDILETGFKILAIIFQMHWRSIVTSLRKTFVRFSNLFGSNAHYIRRFAAEAFSFLLRKSSSIPKLTQFLYEKSAEEDDKNIKDGVVQLLFNGIKGTHKQFHSKTNELLTGYVESALELDDGHVRDTALEILLEVMKLCVHWAKVEYSKNVTEVLLRLLSEQLSKKSAESNIKLLLNLFAPWVTERHGKNFGHPVELFDILKLISAKQNLSQLDYVYLSLIAKTLITYSSKFTDPAAIRQVISGSAKNYLSSINVASVSSVFSFFTELIDLNIFDIWCVSSVGDIVNFVLKQNADDEILKPIVKFFATYCIKRKPFLEEITEQRKLFFDVAPFAKLRDIISEKASNAHVAQDELSLHSLVVYPWLWRPTEKPNCLLEMSAAMKNLLQSGNLSSTLRLITYLTTYSLSLVQPSEIKSITVDQILQFLQKQDVTDEVTLRTAYLLLSNNDQIDSVDHLSYLEEFAKALESCYVCPSGIIRRLALKILQKFDSYLKHGSTNDEGKYTEAESVFKILLDIEESPANIQTYRRRAALIRRVNYKLFDRMMPEGASTLLKQLPLKLVISQLFEKFTLLWPSVHEAVNFFSSSMPNNLFWEVYQNIINLTTAKINGAEENDVEIENSSIFGFLRKTVGDYDNFRIQIFKMMKQFVGVVERNNKEVVDTLINLYRDEYLPVSPGYKKLVDLRKHEDVVEIDHADETETNKDEKFVENKENVESSDEEELENDKEKIEVEKMEEGSEDEIHQDNTVMESNAARHAPRNVRRKKAIEALRTLLETFARFSNPKNVKREPELKDIYNELFKCDQDTLRQVAFHCIVAYRYTFLVPYVDYFAKLLDSKQFREGLVLFSINEENSVVQGGHREELMPYLLKILYGSLSSYVMVRAVARRNAVLTYLGGFQSNEIQYFFAIMFGQLLDYIKINKFSTNLDQLCESITVNYDPSNTLSPKKLKRLVYFL